MKYNYSSIFEKGWKLFNILHKVNMKETPNLDLKDSAYNYRKSDIKLSNKELENPYSRISGSVYSVASNVYYHDLIKGLPDPLLYNFGIKSTLKISRKEYNDLKPEMHRINKMIDK